MSWSGGADKKPLVSNSSSGSMSGSNATGTSAMPAWLRDDTSVGGDSHDPSRPSGGAYAAVPGTSGGVGGGPAAAAGQGSQFSNPDIPRMILYTRVINLILSVCMMIASFLSLLTTTDATMGVLGCYVVVFSCLLCCYETHLKQVSKMIAMSFGFLYSAKSRCVFMMFVGTIMFSLSLFGKLIGLAMLANAGFNVFIIFKYPEFEDAQRSDAQSDIQDFLAANPVYANKAMALGLQAGASIARNNPDLVRQGAEAVVSGRTGGYSQV